MSDQSERRTDHHGTAAPNNDHSITVGPRGPILMQDRYMFEKMQNFNRERIPERVVHARAPRAHGYFEVTRDVSQWTRADVPQPRSASGPRRSCASRPSPASWARADACATRAASR